MPIQNNEGESYQPVFPMDCRKDTKTATIAASGTVSTAVDISAYNKGMFFLTSEFNSDTITILVSNKMDGGFTTLYEDGSAAAYTFAAPAGAAWHRIPEGAFAAGAIKIQTGTGVAAGATITFCLKT